MAKKKSKKNNQKQVEVASPPGNLKPASAVATEESPPNEATPEAQQQSLAPPLEAANDEVSVGPTPVPDLNLEHIQDKPREDEVSTFTGDMDNNKSTPPFEQDHTDASEEQATVSNTDTREHGPTEEAQTSEIPLPQPSIVEAAEQLKAEPTDAVAPQLESTTESEVVARTGSDGLPNGESEVVPEEEQPSNVHLEQPDHSELQSATVVDSLSLAKEAPDVNLVDTEALVADGPGGEAPIAEIIKVNESAIVETEQPVR
jgi:hypothetical protein